VRLATRSSARRWRGSPQTGHTWLLLTLVLILGVTVVSLWAQDAPQPTQTSVPPNTSVEDRLTRLEARMDALNESYTFLRNLLQIGVAVGTLLGFLSALDRWRERSRVESLRNELTTESRAANEKQDRLATLQDERNANLMDAARHNIQGASELFGALTNMMTLRVTADELGKELKALQHKADEQVGQRNSVVAEQNSEAVRIWNHVTRANYASIEQQEMFHQFAVTLASRRKEFTVIDDELNLACYAIAGLDLRKRDIDERMLLLQRAVDLGLRDLADPSRESLRAGMNSDEFKGWTRACTNQVLYHLAILSYNCGNYTDAITRFEQALVYDPSDLGSMLYICEAKFLGKLADFEAIVAEFEAVAALIQARELAGSWTLEKRNQLLSQVWVRLGNCYYAQNPYYASRRSLNAAFEKFKKAYELNPGWYLARFSYAQALMALARQGDVGGAGRGARLAEARSLFAQVFPDVRDKLASTVEAKIRMMLYYMLGICVKEGMLEGELAQPYLTQIHAEKGELGTNPRVLIFSPKTKNDLTVSKFIEEVQEYQRRSLAPTSPVT